MNKRINTIDDNLKKLVDEMFDLMYRTDGIGLSAPQVGINVHLMVFNPVGERGEVEKIVLVNPKVSRYSRRIVSYNEGCLSFPGIYADVERPDSVKIDAQDITGQRFAFDLTGLPVRVFQHEYDHLQGILFFERMTEEGLDSICADLQEECVSNKIMTSSSMILHAICWYQNTGGGGTRPADGIHATPYAFSREIVQRQIVYMK